MNISNTLILTKESVFEIEIKLLGQDQVLSRRIFHGAIFFLFFQVLFEVLLQKFFERTK